MAGTTTSSLDNSGQPDGSERQVVIEFNELVDDVGSAGTPLSVNSTAVGNVTTGEDDLMTYALAANKLNAAGNGVRILAWGTAANNANVKTLKLKFGSDTILSQSLTASQAGFWEIQAVVLRTGSDKQDTDQPLLQTTPTFS